MAKPNLQTIRLDNGIEAILLYEESVNRLRLTAKIMRLVKTLAGYLQGRGRCATVDSFIPRQSHERESRLEFERFIHW